MKRTNIAKTIFFITMLTLMQIAAHAQKAELVVQTGHTDGVDSVTFSPNGRILASGSRDNTIKLWDVESRQQLKSLIGHTAWINSISFSPDGKIFASGSSDSTIKLWSVETGLQLKSLKGHIDSVESVAFSPDGETVASGSSDSTIKLWSVETGQQLKSLEGHAGKVSSVTFSPDGKALASGNGDGTVKLWSVETGQQLKSLEGHAGWVSRVVFSPNSKTLASGNGDGTVKLWSVETGQQLKSLVNNSAWIKAVTFSPDGKALASSGNLDYTIKLWSVETGEKIKSLGDESDLIESVAFSPDGKTLASGNGDGTIKLWSVETGQQLKSLEGHAREVLSVTFSPDGKTLALGNRDSTVKLWSINTGKQLNPLEVYGRGISSVMFSPDGKNLISGGLDHTFILWSIETKRKIRSLEGAVTSVLSAAFSPDGKTLVSGNGGGTIKLWSVETGQQLKSFESGTDSVNSVAFSPDGRILASGSGDNTIKLWNLENGQQLKSFEGHTASVKLVTFSSDGKTLISGSGDNTIKLWNVESGQQLKSFECHTSWIPSMAFSPDEKILTCGNEDGTIKLWNVESGQQLRSLQGHASSINSIAFSPDGNFFVSSGDATTKLWNIQDDKPLATLTHLDEDDWVVIDEDGRFDASPGAQKLMHFVVGLEPVDLEQIKDRYYTPNLLQRIFKGENLDATRPVTIFTADELYPLAEFAPVKAGQTSVSVKLVNRGGGIGRVQVFVNGAEFLADARPKGFDPKSQSAEFAIDFSNAVTLKKGETNEINIIARNQAGWLRSRGSQIVYLDNGQKNDAPQEFYAIIGGVADYENKDFNLRYSAKDARDFARATELGAVKLFGRDHVHIRLLASGAESENAVLTGADSKTLPPSKENFKKAFAEFKRAKPTDVFVAYLSGHGTSINKGGDTGDTYLYLTQEAVTTDKSRLSDDKLREASTVSSDELAEWIRDVPALKRAMILDTCAAGAVEASLIKPRDLSPDQIKALDRMKDRTGFYVLMGSAADAQSYEATRYGQGLLTYSLLQGMSGARLRDGEYADINSLFNYAEDTVTEMAKGIGGIQQPRIIAPTESRSFDIGRFSAIEKSKFTLAKVKPLILQPQLSNDKLKFDNLKLSQTIAKALRDESSTVSRGDAEAALVFVEADEMQDAVTPGGVYEIVGDQIKVTLILVKNNEPLKTITVEGSTADKEELSRKIVRAIIENTQN